MKIIYLLLNIFIGLGYTSKTSRKDRVGSISSRVGEEGEWSDSIYCDDGKYAVGFKLKVEDIPSNYYKSVAFGEKDWVSAIDFRLYCGNEWITLPNGYEGTGSWTTKQCPKGTKIKALETRVDSTSNVKDSRLNYGRVGLNDVKVSCSDTTKISADIQSGATAYTYMEKKYQVTPAPWGKFEKCALGSMVCGFKQKVQSEPNGGGWGTKTDNYGLNGIQLQCCSSRKDLIETTSTDCDVKSVSIGKDVSCPMDITFTDDEPTETTTLTITSTFNLNARCNNPRISYSFFDNEGYQQYFKGDNINIYEGDSTSNSDKIKICYGNNGQCNYKSCAVETELNGNYLDVSPVIITVKVPESHDSKSCSENEKKIESTLTLICERGAKPIINSLPLSAFSWSDSGHGCALSGPTYDGGNAWCANTNDDSSSYVQVDLGGVYNIYEVGTKGRATVNEWVQAYKLEYSINGNTFLIAQKSVNGNSNRNTENIHSFAAKNIIAQYLRFTPLKYQKRKSMRIEAYGDLIDYVDATQAGSIAIGSNGDIIVSEGSLNAKNLYCGAGEDKPIWAGLLSINSNILDKLEAIKTKDQVTKIFEYIQCSEFIYFAVNKAAVPGPVHLLDAINAILVELQKIPIVGGEVGNSIDDISKIIVNLLDAITPNDANVNWNKEWNPDGTIFNPFDKLEKVGTVLSKLVCKSLVGNDIPTLIRKIRDSDAMTNIKKTFNIRIKDLLTNTNNLLYNIFDSDTRKWLLDGTALDARYKSFSIVMTVGMQLCFSKGMNGCITRMHGVSVNLKDNSKIFESRSMFIELPSLSVGVGAKGFVHFDFLAKYKDVTNIDSALNVGLSAQIPGSSNIAAFLEQWEKYSDKLGEIPFISDALSIGDKVSFINGKLEDNGLILDILTGGANARLSIIYALGNSDLLNCNGFRIDLSVGDFNTFDFAVFFGYEYRKNSGEISQGLDWVDEIDKGNFKEFGNIILDISTDTVNIFSNAMDSIGTEIADLGKDIVNTVEAELYNIVNKFIDQVENVANDVIKDANNVIKGTNMGIKTLNNLNFGNVETELSGFKKDCKDIDNKYIPDPCHTFDFGVHTERLCISDIVNLGNILDDICDLVFDDVVDNVLDDLDDIIHEIPNIPTIPHIPTVDIGNVAKRRLSDDGIVNDIHDIHDNGNQKQLWPLFCLVGIMYTIIIFYGGYCLREYLEKKENKKSVIQNKMIIY